MAVGLAKSHFRLLFAFLIRVILRIARENDKNVFFVQIWVLWPVLHRTENYSHFQVQTLGMAVDLAKSHSKAMFTFLVRGLARIARQNNKTVPFVKIWTL